MLSRNIYLYDYQSVFHSYIKCFWMWKCFCEYPFQWFSRWMASYADWFRKYKRKVRETFASSNRKKIIKRGTVDLINSETNLKICFWSYAFNVPGLDEHKRRLLDPDCFILSTEKLLWKRLVTQCLTQNLSSCDDPIRSLVSLIMLLARRRKYDLLTVMWGPPQTLSLWSFFPKSFF